MYEIDRDPLLLTPGPLTTSLRTKAAMLHDWGSWNAAFNRITAEVCTQLLDIAHAAVSHACVPLQASGTFAVEAALGTLVPRHGKVLVHNNGAYCARILRILSYLGREAVELPIAEDAPADPHAIEAALFADPSITHVAQVHCETGTGILNPLAEIAAAVARQGRGLIVDAMRGHCVGRHVHACRLSGIGEQGGSPAKEEGADSGDGAVLCRLGAADRPGHEPDAARHGRQIFTARRVED